MHGGEPDFQNRLRACPMIPGFCAPGDVLCAEFYRGGAQAVSGRTPGHFPFVSYYAARTCAAPGPRGFLARAVRPCRMGGPSPLEVGDSMIRVGQSPLLII